MTSVFSWQNYQSLPCFILHSKAKFACYSRCFLTSYVCIPVPYNEKDISLGVSSKRSCRSSQNRSTSASSALTGQGIDLDYYDIAWFALEMNRNHSVVFEIASNYCISDSFVDRDGYSISSEGFLNINLLSISETLFLFCIIGKFICTLLLDSAYQLYPIWLSLMEFPDTL